jgi:antitoxin VapB
MTTRVLYTGEGQVVHLPQGFEFTTSEVTIRRNGDAVIIEPLRSNDWPPGFFDRIRIDDPAFARPDQGVMPDVPQLDVS